MLDWLKCLNELDKVKAGYVNEIGKFLYDDIAKLETLVVTFLEEDAQLGSKIDRLLTDFHNKKKLIESGSPLRSSVSFLKDTDCLLNIHSYTNEKYEDTELQRHMCNVVAKLNKRDNSLLDRLYNAIRENIVNTIEEDCFSVGDDILLYNTSLSKSVNASEKDKIDSADTIARYIIHLIVAGYNTEIYPVHYLGADGPLARTNSMEKTLETVRNTLLSTSSTFFNETLSYLNNIKGKCLFIPLTHALPGVIYKCDIVESYNYHELYDVKLLDDLQRTLYTKLYADEFVSVDSMEKTFNDRLNFIKLINKLPRQSEFTDMYVYRDLAIGVNSVPLLVYNREQKNLLKEKIKVTYPIEVGDMLLQGEMMLSLGTFIPVMQDVEFPLTCKQLITKLPMGEPVIRNAYDSHFYRSDLRKSITLLDSVTAIENNRFNENGFTDRSFTKDLIYDDTYGYTLFERLNSDNMKIRKK